MLQRDQLFQLLSWRLSGIAIVLAIDARVLMNKAEMGAENIDSGRRHRVTNQRHRQSRHGEKTITKLREPTHRKRRSYASRSDRLVETGHGMLQSPSVENHHKGNRHQRRQ